MPEAEDAEIMTPYEDYSVEALKDAFKRLFFLSDFNDADIAEMDKILALLRERDPLPPTRSVDEMWEEFQSIYANDLANIGIRETATQKEVIRTEPESDVVSEIPSVEKTSRAFRMRHRKLFRIGVVAAVLIVLFAAVTAAAAAFGYNLWGWLPVWSEEDVRFVAEDTEKPYAETIPDVLNRLGIDEPLYPTWLPEDLKQTSTRILEKPLLLYEMYTHDDRELSITISPTTGSEYTIYQKTENPPMEYLVGGVVHYIFDNTNNLLAVWNTENYSTVIAGNIQIEEMEKIIDSVYGELK